MLTAWLTEDQIKWVQRKTTFHDSLFSLLLPHKAHHNCMPFTLCLLSWVKINVESPSSALSLWNMPLTAIFQLYFLMKYCVQERLNWKKWELCVTSNFVFPGALLQIRFVAPVPHPPAKVTTMAVFSSHMSCIQDPQPFSLKPVGLAPRFKANKKKKKRFFLL